MNIHQSYLQGPFNYGLCQLIRSRNKLDINRIDYLKDTERCRLIIFLEIGLSQVKEVNAFLKEKTLIIEAPLIPDYAKPFRTHLMAQEILSYEEDGVPEIGFSEVQLDKGYNYELCSFHMINPGLLKVILSYHPTKNKNKYETN
jgi:hypothetical protein